MKPFQDYASKGYYVSRGTIPMSLVARLAAAFRQDAKCSSEKLLRQSNLSEASKLDSYGFMTQPLLQPHLSTAPALETFRQCILNVACSAAMLGALREVTLRPKHYLHQIMIFEQATTAPHQDWVYLDSFPSGNICAAWVALEDIHSTATRFFVVPGSQDFEQEFTREDIFRSGKYLETMKALVAGRYSDQIVIPDMSAGDVLFWNSRLIHGSLPGTDPTRSRLSLTAHFVPDGFGFGSRDRPQVKPYPFPVVEGRPIEYIDQSVLSAYAD